MSKDPPESQDTEQDVLTSLIPVYNTDKSLALNFLDQLDPEILAALPVKDKSTIAGFGFIDGGNFEGDVKLAGRTSSKDPIICENLKIAGVGNLRNFVAVKNQSSLAGTVRIGGHAIFGGETKIAGTLKVLEHIITSGDMTLAGKVNVEGHLLTESHIELSGRLTARSLHSLDTVLITGRISLEEDLKAQTIVFHKAAGYVSGNIKAEHVRLAKDVTDLDVPRQRLSNPVDVFNLVFSIMKRSLFGTGSRPLFVEGDVIAKEISVDNMDVGGDVRGDIVRIGPNTQIEGKIYYQSDIELPDGFDEERVEMLPYYTTTTLPKTEDMSENL